MNAARVTTSVIAGLILLIGIAFYLTGALQPLYTDSDAPGRISDALRDLPRDERWNEWYAQLANYETTHKRYTDIGRGLISFGIGIFTGMLFLKVLGGFIGGKKILVILIFWLILWGIKFPLSLWYYSLRQGRFDYPVWGDSIGIGVFQDYTAWVIGFIVSSITYLFLMIGYRQVFYISLQAPQGRWGWTRFVFLWLWLLLLLVCIFPAIMDGDEGMIISCTGAVPIFLLCLSAIPKMHNNTQ